MDFNLVSKILGLQGKEDDHVVEPTCICFVVSLELKSRGCTAEGQSIFEMEGSG